MYKLTDTAQKTLEERYFAKDANGKCVEDWESMIHRAVNSIFCRHYNFPKDRIIEPMLNGELLANSPLYMAGARSNHACYVLSVKDSMHSIINSWGEVAIISKWGGGSGLRLDDIRPSGTPIKREGQIVGYAAGPVSFLYGYDGVGESMQQGGTRKAAIKADLGIDHPDIYKFIEAKQDLNRFKNINLSVSIPDWFMHYFTAGGAYPVGWKNKYKRIRNTTKVLQDIAYNAWDVGDPGVMFSDTLNKHNPIKEWDWIETSNPCWSGDTRLYTAFGIMSFVEILENGFDKVPVLSQDDAGKLCMKNMEPRMTSAFAKLLKITTDNGASFKCTPNHNLFLKDGTKIQAKDLKQGDRLTSLWLHRKDKTLEYLNLINNDVVLMEHHTLKPYRIERNNHRDHCVVSVEKLPGTHPVYNGAVEDTHKYFVCGFENDAILSANCGEYNGWNYTACNLASIDVSKMIINPRFFNEDYNPDMPVIFDTYKFCSTVEAAVYMLNMSIDKSQYPLDIIQERTTQLRPIGIGIMGLADAFLQFGFDYGDEGSIALTKNIGNLLMETAKTVSADIAAVEGPFPMDYLIKEPHQKVRNIRLTAIAPTGTISLMADCSPGVEPNITTPDTITTRMNINKRDLKQQSKWTGVLENIPTIYNTTPEAQFAVLSALANTIDGGISKTMAMPFESTPDDIYHLIQKAWQSNLCGITFFRHGCRKAANLQEHCQCGGVISYDTGCRTCSKCGAKSCSV